MVTQPLPVLWGGWRYGKRRSRRHPCPRSVGPRCIRPWSVTPSIRNLSGGFASRCCNIRRSAPAHSGKGHTGEVWARMATLSAGKNRGSWVLPEVGDEVLVAFAGGDPGEVYVIGSLWNGVDGPPEEATYENDHKTFKSRSGIKIRLSDRSGEESLVIETPGGNRVTIQDNAGVEIEDESGNRVSMNSGGIALETSGKLSLNASQVEISAGSVSTQAGMSDFSGVIQGDTVIATSVVASSYTPGAGNIW